MDLKSHIRHVPDFPKKGILFYDISTLLAHKDAWRHAVHQMAKAIKPYKPTVLAGIESRGFLVAAPVALELGLGFVMLRKKGKLPGETIRYTYSLEYGTDTIEVQENAVKPGDTVVVLDDLLATGGTMAAAVHLLRLVKANVAACSFLIELTFLKGREKLDVPVTTLMQYDS